MTDVTYLRLDSMTDESAVAAIRQAGFSVTESVDKYGIARWEFVTKDGHAWMLSREKLLKTGWLYSRPQPAAGCPVGPARPAAPRTIPMFAD